MHSCRELLISNNIVENELTIVSQNMPKTLNDTPNHNLIEFVYFKWHLYALKQLQYIIISQNNFVFVEGAWKRNVFVRSNSYWYSYGIRL